MALFKFAIGQLMEFGSDARASAIADASAAIRDNSDVPIEIMQLEGPAFSWLCETERNRWNDSSLTLAKNALVWGSLAFGCGVVALTLLSFVAVGGLAAGIVALPAIAACTIGALGSLALLTLTCRDLIKLLAKGYCEIAEIILVSHGRNVLILGERGVSFATGGIASSGSTPAASYHLYSDLAPPSIFAVEDLAVVQLSTKNGTGRRSMTFPGPSMVTAQHAVFSVLHKMQGDATPTAA